MSSTVERIILAGFGGQGIHGLGRILAETGMNVGKSVSCITFGNDDLIGCDSNCSVILADNEIASPMVTVPDAVIAMNKEALAKYSYKIKAGPPWTSTGDAPPKPADGWIPMRPTRSRAVASMIP